MKHLSRLWRGELALENAFWNWAVIGGLLVNFSSALFLMLISADRPILALVVGYSFSVPYNIVVIVGVWRSAAAYTGDRRAADLMRIVTTVGGILLSVT